MDIEGKPLGWFQNSRKSSLSLKKIGLIFAGFFVIVIFFINHSSVSQAANNLCTNAFRNSEIQQNVDIASLHDHIDPALLESSKSISTLQSSIPARIIKVTFQYGKGSIDSEGHKSGMDKLRDRTLQTHFDHAKLHGHRQIVQKVDLMGNIYTKTATVLNIIIEELAKPEGERAEWVMSHDADMVIMNRNIPIDIFLPPKEKDINLLVTYDGNGLNTGAFLIRVSSWAVELLSANIGYAYLPGARHWEFAEQGMMSNLIHDVEKFKSKTMEIPRRWINAYPSGWGEGYITGDLLVHLVAWAKKDTAIWLEKSESLSKQYNVSPEESGLRQWIDKFWKEH